MKKIYGILLSIILPCVLLSCHENKESKEIDSSWAQELLLRHDDSDKLLEYICVDVNGCAHSTRKCHQLDSLYQVFFIDTTKITFSCFESVCSNCFSNKRSKHLWSIARRNSKDTILH